jgi:hypothetical protein
VTAGRAPLAKPGGATIFSERGSEALMIRFLMVSIAMSAAAVAAVTPVRAQSPNPVLLAPSGALPGLAPPAPSIPGQHSGIPLAPSGRVGGTRYVQVPGSSKTVMIPGGTKFNTFHDRVSACTHYGAASGLRGGRLSTFTATCAN